MSANASPDPTNLVVLAAVGVGAFWFLTRRAAAQPANVAGVAAPSPNAAGMSQRAATNIGLLGAVGKALFGGRAAYASSAIDGVAYNPTGSVSPFNAIAGMQAANSVGGYASNDPAAWWQ